MVKPTSLILVAVMNDPHDLEIARLLGWYRIPLRTAPKVVAVDYLAFYLTSAFADKRWAIEYLAPVRGHELVTRLDLFKDEVDHPRAREEYFKIQLGPLERLPAPLPAGKWKRITFLYTTGEHLLKAQTISNLVVASENRRYLWQALRERAEQGQTYHAQELPELDLDLNILSALLGFAE
jgi:DNA helicase HerA-like ATPase